MHLRTSNDARRPFAVPQIVLALLALVLAGSTPHAQTPPAGSRPQEVGLQRGRQFPGDVRQLPGTLPPQRERRPDRDDEPTLRRDNSPDRAAQTLAPSAPAPSPGTGGGAGNFAGLDFAGFGDGWPPDPNGDVGPTYYIQTVNT